MSELNKLTMLPTWTISGKFHDPPRRSFVIAQCDKTNEHGVTTRFKVYTNIRKNVWWLGASFVDEDGKCRYRRSSGMRTISRKRMEQWIADMKAGNVAIATEEI